MLTLQQLRARSYNEIGQTEGSVGADFTASEINGFINDAIDFTAALIQWPRDLVEVQLEEGKNTYTLLSDTQNVRLAYFGDRSIKGDVRKINILTEEVLAELYPSWLSNDSTERNRPTCLFFPDRSSVRVYPTPNAAESVAGKKLYLSYVYNTASLSQDGDKPDLPPSYHPFLQIYVAHKCYGGKLKNPDMSKLKEDEFMRKIKLLEPKVDREMTQMYWGWGEDLNVDGIANPISDLRLI